MATFQDTRPAFQHLQMQDVETLFQGLKTPSYIMDEQKLIENAKLLSTVMKDTGCKILLAQKAFSHFQYYPELSHYLAGTEASGLYEARLGKEEMPNKEVHVFCGAFRDEDIEAVLDYADHIVFNSIYQLEKYGHYAKSRQKSVGLRVNPECSTQEGHDIYDPCAFGSRLGVTREQWNQHMTKECFALLDGLHFHTLCEQNSDDLKTTLNAIEQQFGDVLPSMKWLNMGGGHHVTREDYDLKTLYECIAKAQKQWNVEVYLEPGEAVALNAGFFMAKVLDIVENNGMKIAIIDGSAACHMPDVIEMPYTPPLWNAYTDASPTHSYHYRLGGPTCLSGDVIGDYYFDHELQRGEILIFGDMAIYTTCKNNTFNGMPLPSIYSWTKENTYLCLKQFDYEDFKQRLG